MTTEKTHEPGYRPVLLREETKLSLQQFRRALANRDLNQERRLITAAVELCMAKTELHSEWLDLVPSVVNRDIESQRAATSGT